MRGMDNINQLRLGMSISDFYFGAVKGGLVPLEYCSHMASWWPHHNEKHILFLHYEDLKENLELCIGKIAEFLNISIIPQLVELVKQRSSLAYMSAHRHKFIGRPPDPEGHGPMLPARVSTVKEGGSQNEQGARNLPEEIKQGMDKDWQELVFPATGCKNYDELRAITSLLNDEKQQEQYQEQ